MADVKYSPFTPRGTVAAPPSKSDVHRAVICAALSKGVCKISPVALSEDIRATIACVEALGAETEINDGTLTVDGSAMFENNTARLFCSESGSTLRFMVPVAAAGGVSAEFGGRGSLLKRPVDTFARLLPERGVSCETAGTLPLKISGRLESGDFRVEGNISSQYITGLLLALPLLDGDSRIILTSPLQSAGYINMTLYTMSRFGVTAEPTGYGWFIRGNQRYQPRDYKTDGDWSQAAFYLALGALGGKLTVSGLNPDSAQGDREIASLLSRFGAKISFGKNGVTAEKAALKAITIDASQIPDLVPVLSVCAALAQGVTKITNAERLRIKESDRLRSTAALLSSLGVSVRENPDGLEITGVSAFSHGSVDGFNDHRIVMSAAVCACAASGEIICSDALSVNKSYPDFFRDYNGIGGKADVLDLR